MWTKRIYTLKSNDKNNLFEEEDAFMLTSVLNISFEIWTEQCVKNT